MKKLISLLLILFSLFTVVSCNNEPVENNQNETPEEPVGPETPEPEEPEEPEIPIVPEEPGIDFTKAETSFKDNLSQGGYLDGKITDFSQYENTEAYVVVTTPEELVDALEKAKYIYTNAWNENTLSIDQELSNAGTVHVIEIANDLELGWNKLSTEVQNSSITADYIGRKTPTTSMAKEFGITQIKIQNTNNLLIYSKVGARITHAGISILSSHNVVVRNLDFDELWEWEDSSSNTTAKIGDYDTFGWAYFKISHCGQIWIDHCSFGKSFDGQIDYSNPVSNTYGTRIRMPYEHDGTNGLHISFCSFNAGSDDPDGYLYQMMSEIEEDYISGGNTYLYYNALRSSFSFEDIFYGLVIPQKKGFLLGDDSVYSGDGSYTEENDFTYNLKLQVSFNSCYFKNLLDRIPKVRGGNCYMYNSIVDNFEYIPYRTKMAGTAASLVTAVNSTWKCAFVSQGILSGNRASVMAENTIFRGINTLLKNNDSKNVSPHVLGGYKLVNCTEQLTAASPISVRNVESILDVSNKTKEFEWHTADGLALFTITPIALDNLEEFLFHTDYGVGTKLNVVSWLISI